MWHGPHVAASKLEQQKSSARERFERASELVHSDPRLSGGKGSKGGKSNKAGKSDGERHSQTARQQRTPCHTRCPCLGKGRPGAHWEAGQHASTSAGERNPTVSVRDLCRPFLAGAPSLSPLPGTHINLSVSVAAGPEPEFDDERGTVLVRRREATAGSA